MRMPPLIGQVFKPETRVGVQHHTLLDYLNNMELYVRPF